MAENACLIGEGFEGACQEPPAYAVRWADNGDGGLLCEAHAAVARAMQNGHAMTLRSLSPESAPSVAYRSVHKFTLSEPVTLCDVRQGARVLCVQTQDGHPCVWFEVDSDGPDERREFVAVPTGGEIEPGAVYVGTAHGIDGWMVFHIYERAEPRKDT